MTILDFTKPKKLRSTEEHNEMYQSDSGVAGTYVPNMSKEDEQKWRGKQIGGQDPRIEIRKTIHHHDPVKNWATNSQILIVVRPDGTVKMSANGAMFFDFKTWTELHAAVQEAREKLL